MPYTTNEELNQNIDAATIAATIYINQNYNIETYSALLNAHIADGVNALPVEQQAAYMRAMVEKNVAQSISSQLFTDGMGQIAEAGSVSFAIWGKNYTQQIATLSQSMAGTVSGTASLLSDMSFAFKGLGAGIGLMAGIVAVANAGENAGNEIVKQAVIFSASAAVAGTLTPAMGAVLGEVTLIASVSPVAAPVLAVLAAGAIAITVADTISDSWDFIRTGLSLGYTPEQIYDGLISTYEDKWNNFQDSFSDLVNPALDAVMDQVVEPVSEGVEIRAPSARYSLRSMRRTLFTTATSRRSHGMRCRCPSCAGQVLWRIRRLR